MSPISLEAILKAFLEENPNFTFCIVRSPTDAVPSGGSRQTTHVFESLEVDEDFIVVGYELPHMFSTKPENQQHLKTVHKKDSHFMLSVLGGVARLYVSLDETNNSFYEYSSINEVSAA